MKRNGCIIMVRCAAFIVLFSLIFSHTTSLLMRHDDEASEIHAFYDEPKDSIDVLYIGSSPLLRDVSPMIMWNEHGFTGYVRASALQAPAVSYGLLAESLRYQSPSLVVLLCDNIYLEYDYSEREGDLRRGLDGMKFSGEKLSLAKKITDEDPNQSLLSYLFPIMRYHDRWKEVDWSESKPETLLKHSYKKGNVYLRETTPQEYPENFMEPSGNAAEFNEESAYYIEKSIELCEKKGISVLILHLPKMSWSYEQSAALEDFANEHGADYLDLDRAENRVQLNLDPQTDYYDQGHMGLTGTIKVSEFLGAWLDNTYNLPDRRNDTAYAEGWNTDWEKYAAEAGLDTEN